MGRDSRGPDEEVFIELEDDVILLLEVFIELEEEEVKGLDEDRGFEDVTGLGEFLTTFVIVALSRGFSISVGSPFGPTYNTEGTPDTGNLLASGV